jgi:hypothetical protein
MDKFMETNRDPSAPQLKSLKRDFKEALDRCETFWGNDAFKRFDGRDVRNQFLAGMYDAQMVAVSLISVKRAAALAGRSAQILKATKQLFDAQGQFESWVRYGTNTKSSVLNRVNSIKTLLDNL